MGMKKGNRIMTGRRKKTVMFLVIAFLLIALPLRAEQRCVLVEYFTAVTCAPCTTTWTVLDTLTQFYSAESLAIIRYYPDPGDPFYQSEAASIQGYYGAYFYPWAFFDGPDDVFGSYPEQYTAKIESLLAVPSPLDMNLAVAYDTLSREGAAVCCMMATDSVSGSDLYLRYALVESELPYGGAMHNQVLRAAFPSALGTPIEIGQGETCGDTVTFTLDSLWQPENCDLVAFIQNQPTKEVIQSIRRPLHGPRDPAVVKGLDLIKAGTSVSLSWSAVTRDKRGYLQPVDHYRVYRDTGKFYQPQDAILLDSTANLFYIDGAAGHVGDPTANCFYYVTAVANGHESTPSAGAGEIDKYLPRK
jgi:hypothetical protein